MTRHVVFAILAVVTLAAGDTPRASAPQASAVVVAELFTSEGCSSCPPADQLLATLADGSMIPGIRVIAMSEHVDYWNDLGWRDPFSSAIFSDRQRAYAARQFQSHSEPYTPQLVVDGRTEVVGSDRTGVRNAIQATAKIVKTPIAVSASRSEDGRALLARLSVRRDSDVQAKQKADVVLAVTEDRLFTDVRRGENGGRRLYHTGVVRALLTVGTLESGDATFERDATVKWDPAWTADSVNVVALLQERGSLHVIGAAAAPIK